MIYTICEYSATVIDCVILFWFLICSLSFKNVYTPLKVAFTILFSALMIVNIALLNYFFTLEGVFTIIYLTILFGFSRAVLQGKWWYQLVLALVGLAAIFLTNAIITILSSLILNEEYSDLLIMRNPARIILLFFSKIVLLCMLIPIANLIQKMKITLHVFHLQR